MNERMIMGLNWTDKVAFALQDANRNNARGLDQWLQYGRAGSVADIRNALRNLGTPWVNTIAADRHVPSRSLRGTDRRGRPPRA